MADYIVQESDGVSRFTLEDGSGSILLELQAAADTLFAQSVMCRSRKRPTLKRKVEHAETR